MAENQKGFIMQTEIKKAAGRTAAGQNKLTRTSYQRIKPMSSSNLKESIGELLLYLQTPIGRNKKQKGYSLLEILLTQSYQGSSQYGNEGQDTAPESTN